MGVIQKFELMEKSAEAEATRYRYRVEYTGMSLFLAIAVNKDGKISSFALQPE